MGKNKCMKSTNRQPQMYEKYKEQMYEEGRTSSECSQKWWAKNGKQWKKRGWGVGTSNGKPHPYANENQFLVFVYPINNNKGSVIKKSPKIRQRNRLLPNP